MSLITDEQIKKLKEANIKIPNVNSSCIGCSACVAISWDVFELNDEWLSVVKYLDNYENLWVDDSIMACPVNAISWK